MFVASKLLSFATQPLSWVVALLLLGLVFMSTRRTWGVRLCWAALGVLLLQGWQPLPDALLRQLEARYPGPAPTSRLESYVGIVLLGGALESGRVWQAHGQPALNDAAERMTAPIALLRQYPHMRVLFTGGEGELTSTGMTEAERAKIFFDSMGVPAQRMIYESASHTTYENAILSAKVPGVDPTQRWLLLTSAFHMPRAMALFQKAGWNVTPYPVDFRTATDTGWTSFSLVGGAEKWHMVLHELAGLLAYRLAGRA